MYAKSVNRGLTFPKPGIYATGLILLVGLLGIGTGINGLYLFMAFGLATLIVSGLLSERMIRNVHLPQQQDVVIDPEAKSCRIKISARGGGSHIYRIEAFLLEDFSARQVFTAKPRHLAEGQALMIPAGEQTEICFQWRSEGRGVYSAAYIMFRSGFPFGLLDKYRIEKLSFKLLHPPASDHARPEALSADPREATAHRQDDLQFLGLRRYDDGDAIRHFDHKRNASKPVEQWMTRLYAGSKTEKVIKIDLEALTKAQEANEYEVMISRIYSAVIADRGQSAAEIVFSDIRFRLIPSETVEFFCAIPLFGERSQMSDFISRWRDAKI